MIKKYSNEQQIIDLVRSFEDATVERKKWRHAEHMTVALYYVCRYDLATATMKMRTGLCKLLTVGFGIDLSKEMPYHETLTGFWMRIVANFNASSEGVALQDKVNQLAGFYDKDHPLRFYTREYLYSDEARAVFVEPDLHPIDDPTQ